MGRWARRRSLSAERGAAIHAPIHSTETGSEFRCSLREDEFITS